MVLPGFVEKFRPAIAKLKLWPAGVIDDSDWRVGPWAVLVPVHSSNINMSFPVTLLTTLLLPIYNITLRLWRCPEAFAGDTHRL
jgi:hypothetical protein